MMLCACDVQQVRLVVDRCDVASIEETDASQTSTEDRRACEAVSQTPGKGRYLSISTPLQIGGRSNSKITYPQNVARDGFYGCIKNLVHNGQVFPNPLCFSGITTFVHFIPKFKSLNSFHSANKCGMHMWNLSLMILYSFVSCRWNFVINDNVQLCVSYCNVHNCQNYVSVVRNMSVIWNLNNCMSDGFLK